MDECLNCGDATADTYELLLRNNNYRDVPLCDDCHDAIQETIPETE